MLFAWMESNLICVAYLGPKSGATAFGFGCNHVLVGLAVPNPRTVLGQVSGGEKTLETLKGKRLYNHDACSE